MFLGNIQVLEIGFELRGGSIWGVCGLRKWKKLLTVDIFLQKTKKKNYKWEELSVRSIPVQSQEWSKMGIKSNTWLVGGSTGFFEYFQIFLKNNFYL